MIARLFLDVEPNLFLNGVRFAILSLNVINIELFKKCDIHSQNNPPTFCHILSQKSDDSSPPCMTQYVNGLQETGVRGSSMRETRFHGRKFNLCTIWQFFKQVKPQPGLFFRGGKVVLEQSRGTKSKSLFHSLCYHNQMDNACAGKDEYVLTTEVVLNQNFMRSLPSYEDKATIKNCKMIPRGDKVLAACCPGVLFATLYHRGREPFWLREPPKPHIQKWVSMRAIQLGIGVARDHKIL